MSTISEVANDLSVVSAAVAPILPEVSAAIALGELAIKLAPYIIDGCLLIKKETITLCPIINDSALKVIKFIHEEL